MSKDFEAPIYENTILGGIEVTSDNGFILHSDVLANNTIKKKSLLNYTLEFLKSYSNCLNS